MPARKHRHHGPCRSGAVTRVKGGSPAPPIDAVALALRVAQVWDLPRVTIDLGVSAGGELLYERFETQGSAPARLTLAADVGAGAGASIPLGVRTFLEMELAA